MAFVGAQKPAANFLLCLIGYVAICAGMKEVFVEEGKEYTLTCTGNRTRHLKNIWWTSKHTTVSRCHPGGDRCINYNAISYKATYSQQHQKYSSTLTISSVGPGHRNQTFQCVDDGGAHKVDGQSFILRVYRLPETPECKAEELSRGRLKVSCQTSKVYPGIRCEISQEFRVYNDDMWNTSITEVNANGIVYQARSFKDGPSEYNLASCSQTVDTFQPGVYRFKVKMYPRVINTLVASVDGYTNAVTIQALGKTNASGTEIKERIARKLIEGRAEALAMTDNEITSKQGQIITRGPDIRVEEAGCENYKDMTINRQLLVIMFLTCLVACMFLVNIFPVVRDAVCKKIKRKTPPQL